MASTKPVPTKYPGVRYRGRVLYFRFCDERGVYREVKYGVGAPEDAAAARYKARERVARIKHGLLDANADAVSRREREPIASVIADYAEFLWAKGNTEHHVRVVRGYCDAWASAMRVRSLVDGTPGLLTRWLKSHRAWSPRTHRYARGAVLALYRWAERTNRLGRNVMQSGVVPLRREGDPVAPRRALTVEEFGRLLESLAARAKPSMLSGGVDVRVAYRRVFYLVLAGTGLRWTEAARLTWEDVSLSAPRAGGRPGDAAGVLTVQAHQSKTGARADLPLVPAVADALRSIGPGPPASRVFRFGAPQRRTWLADLAAAGVEARDERGHNAARASLRKSLCTWMRDAGVDLRDAQKLMRHADPKMTAGVYTDTELPRLAECVRRVTAFLSTPCLRLVGEGELTGRSVEAARGLRLVRPPAVGPGAA